MPAPEFSSALPFVLRWEGGFVDHPADPGGRTNKGITQKVYDGWRARNGLAPADVKTITDSEVRAIYERDYWLPPRCNVLQDPLSLVQFDTAVNMGVGRAVRFLQTAVGCGVDGKFGDGTLSAVQSCDLAATIITYCDTRGAFYRRLVENRPELGVFLKGWSNRLNALRKEAGLPGFEAIGGVVELGDAGYMGRIPDIGSPGYDF